MPHSNPSARASATGRWRSTSRSARIGSGAWSNAWNRTKPMMS
jgi:hypothetical protein